MGKKWKNEKSIYSNVFSVSKSLLFMVVCLNVLGDVFKLNLWFVNFGTIEFSMRQNFSHASSSRNDNSIKCQPLICHMGWNLFVVILSKCWTLQVHWRGLDYIWINYVLNVLDMSWTWWNVLKSNVQNQMSRHFCFCVSKSCFLEMLPPLSYASSSNVWWIFCHTEKIFQKIF